MLGMGPGANRRKEAGVLAGTDEQLRLLVENMGDMVSWHLPDSTISSFGPWYRDLVEYALMELPGTLLRRIRAS